MSILSNATQQAINSTPKVGTTRLSTEQFHLLLDKRIFINSLCLKFKRGSDERQRLEQAYNNIDQRIANHWNVAF